MVTNSSDTILKNLLDGVLIVDGSGEIIYANKAAESLFSRSNENLVGQPFGHPVNPYEVQEMQVLRDGKVLTVQMLATAIHWDNREACLLSIRDITEIKKIATELKVQKDKLETTNRDLEQYASLASHDLKEPVRKIMIYTQRLLARNDYGSVEQVKDDLNRIYKSATRMRSLINGIAEYSRYTDADEMFVPVDLNEVVREVVTDLEMMIAEKNAQIKWGDLPTVEAIKIQMHQLFLNIISNAIKYAKSDVAPEISITQRDLDTEVEITIADNGIGFDDTYADKVFLPFERLHSDEYEGTGIGLAICKKIAKRHGGDISVRSIPGDGSQFILTLNKRRPAALHY